MIHTLVQWIVGVRLQEEILHSDQHGVQVKDWFPVLTENVQANVSFEIYVRMIDLEEMNMLANRSISAPGTAVSRFVYI